ncbi:MAG: alpha/beta fold hydrolase [Bacteroidales bacterium]|nr:alpha/beta fold hydrolase [Bacteroidales bacterium]
MIRGYFYPAKETNAQTLLFTQGFMDSGDIWDLGKTLSENNINVFSFDFRGCFESEGEQGLMNSQEDIGAALTFLASAEMVKKYKIDTANIILGGYSYGGHMSMLYALYHPEIKRVISISGGDLGIVADLMNANPQMRKGYSNFFQTLKKPDGPVDFLYDDPIEELIKNRNYFSILDQTGKLANVDIFLAGGTDDGVVSLENYVLPLYRRIKKNEGQKITTKIYQDGHSYQNCNEQLIRDILEWLIRSLNE